MNISLRHTFEGARHIHILLLCPLGMPACLYLPASPLGAPPFRQFYLLRHLLLQLFVPLSALTTCLSPRLLSKCIMELLLFLLLVWKPPTYSCVALSHPTWLSNHVERMAFLCDLGHPLWQVSQFTPTPDWNSSYHDMVHLKLKFVLQWHLPPYFFVASFSFFLQLPHIP